MVKYYIRRKSKSSFGKAKEYTPIEIRRLRKNYPSLKFIKVKKRKLI